MMERKHTPPPWTADTDKKNYGTDETNPIFIHGGEHGQILICEMNHSTRHMMFEPSDVEADARLIAAAPDLLAAGEDALRVLDAIRFPNLDGPTGQAIAALRTAIEKATKVST